MAASSGCLCCDDQALSESRRVIRHRLARLPPCFVNSRCSGYLTEADPLAAQTQKNKDGLIDALYIFDIEMPDAASEFIFWYCGDLINHESRKSVKAVAFVRRNRNAKQRRLSWISCHDADRDGFGGIEAIILENHRRPWLTGVILRPSDRPYFSTFQSVTRLQ